MRVLIKFLNPESDNPHISSAIAASCHCLPLFLRKDRADVLIYQVTLPQNLTFEDFEKSMRQQAVSLQIEFVEQDSIMQTQ